MATPPSSKSVNRRGSSSTGRRPAQGLVDDLQLIVSTKGHEHAMPDSVIDKVLSIGLTTSIQSGSTLTIAVRDPERVLQRLGYFTQTNISDLELDDLWFRCCHFGKNVDEYTLEAEDREIAMAREYTKHFEQSAGQGPHTNPRALYLKNLFHKAVPHAKFFCPEIGKKPKVLPYEATHEKKAKHKKGGSSHDMTLEGAKLDSDQVRNVEILMGVCDEKNAPLLAHEAILCAACGESTLHTLTTPNSSGYWGVLQGGSGQNGSAANFPNTPNAQVTKEMAQSFLDGGRGYGNGPKAHGRGAIALIAAGMTDPGEIATEVEDSGEAPSFYGKFRDDVRKMIANAGNVGDGLSSGSAEAKYTPQRNFSLPISKEKEGNEPEGAWENGTSYADEVAWRLFCYSGQINFVSDEFLERQKPAMHFDEGTVGITDIKWEIDRREKANPPNMEVEARASRWYAPPGTAVVIGEKQGKELHEGVWLVSQIERPDITDNATTITLERPKSPLAEHALAPVARAKKEPQITAPTPAAPGNNPTPDGGNNAGPGSPLEGGVLFEGTSTPKAKWNPHGKLIANWIVPILQWASEHGWDGVVESGFRTFQEQTRINSEGLFSAPAGESNHETYKYPGGAVDVTFPGQLIAVLSKYPHSPKLVGGKLGAIDPEHFSAKGN